MIFQIFFHPDELDGMFDKRLYNNDEVERKIADYIAGMTDNFLFATYKNLKKQKKLKDWWQKKLDFLLPMIIKF